MKSGQSICTCLSALSVVAIGAALAGCASHEGDVATALLHEGDSNTGLARQVVDDPATAGQNHFTAGRYGLAEQSFRKAITAQPDNAAAWLGLAATYDQLKRFDLAERAYGRVVQLHGRSAEILNNLGYHYLMQGKKAKARQQLEAAAQLAPGNAKIQANLRLLETGSSQSLVR